MDDVRVPIDLTEEHAPGEGDQRSVVKQDGTLVINILLDSACTPNSEGEIVVCAPRQSEHRLDPVPAPPAEEGFKPELQLGGNATVGARAETDGQSGAERVMVDLKIKF